MPGKVTRAARRPAPKLETPRHTPRSERSSYGWSPRTGNAARRATELSTTTFEASAAPDARKFMAEAMEDIARRTRAGEKVVVVFDIDDTLADTRYRTLALARAFDEANGTSHFANLTVDQVARTGEETARRLGLPESVVRAFDAYWDVGFWKAESLVHDQPMKEIVELAKKADAAGARVLYLTGRVQAVERGTLAQLRRFGLPDVNATNVISKPSLRHYTPAFKAERLDAWMKRGFYVSFFFTESRRDIAHLQRAEPKVPCVLLDSSHGGRGAVREGTPVWPRIF